MYDNFEIDWRTFDHAKFGRQVLSVMQRGYTKFVRVKGKFGASELCMHVGMAEEEGIFALVRPDDEHMIYAYVFGKTGRVVDGSFHLRPDGTFSVS